MGKKKQICKFHKGPRQLFHKDCTGYKALHRERTWRAGPTPAALTTIHANILCCCGLSIVLFLYASAGMSASYTAVVADMLWRMQGSQLTYTHQNTGNQAKSFKPEKQSSLASIAHKVLKRTKSEQHVQVLCFWCHLLNLTRPHLTLNNLTSAKQPCYLNPGLWPQHSMLITNYALWANREASFFSIHYLCSFFHVMPQKQLDSNLKHIYMIMAQLLCTLLSAEWWDILFMSWIQPNTALAKPHF